MDPRGCSQCLGFVPRRIVRDEATGSLTMDGVSIAPSFARGSQPSRFAAKVQARKLRAKARDDAAVDED